MQSRPPDFLQELARSRSHLPGPHLSVIVDSMLAGNTAGKLWRVDQSDALPAHILWDKGNDVFYFAVDCSTDESIEALAAIVSAELLPQARLDEIHRIKIRALTSSTEDALPRLFPNLTLRSTITRFAIHDESRPVSAASTRLSGVTLRSITAALLADRALGSMDKVRQEIDDMWPSTQHFHEHGFGTVALLDGQVICFCTAEYLSRTHCGVGIASDSRYRSQGVATSAAIHFVAESRRRGLIPCWECDTENLPSVRVAEKAGFVWQSEETYWVGVDSR